MKKHLQKKAEVFNQEKQDELKKMNFLDLFLHPKDSLKDKERRSCTVYKTFID